MTGCEWVEHNDRWLVRYTNVDVRQETDGRWVAYMNGEPCPWVESSIDLDVVKANVASWVAPR